MYRQVPLNGTERQRPEERRKQAVKAPEEHSELKALLALQDCDVVPELLAHETGEQSADELVPGGYFIHFVWAKVPGEPLDVEVFWTWNKEKRAEIREKFKNASLITAFGWEPGSSTLRKIIYDCDTKTMRVSGFSAAWPIDPKEPWSDALYGDWDLVDLTSTQRMYWEQYPEEWTW